MNEHMPSLLKVIREAPLQKGTAALWWMGQMGLWIKLAAQLISVDYFASPIDRRQTPPPVPAEEVEGVTLFLGTHDHLDHIDHEAWKIWGRTCPDAVFGFPRLHEGTVLQDGIRPGNLLGLNDGEQVRVGGVTIRAIAAAHEFLDRDESTGLYPCLQYVIEGDGLRIWHAGDGLRYEGLLPRLQALGPLDASVLPINGRDGARYRRSCIGNMTFQEAADLAGELAPGVVIPGHWDMFADNPGDPAAFADYLDAKYPGRVRCVIPEIGKPVLLQAAR